MVVEESCEGCGAPLPKPDDTGWVTCESCGRSYQVAEPKPEPVAEPPAVTINIEGLGDLSEAMSAAGGTPAAMRGKAGWLGCIPVVVLLVVGTSIFFSVKGCASDARDAIEQIQKGFQTPSNAISLSGSVTPIGTTDGGTDVAMVTQVNEGSTTTRRITRVRFGPGGAKELWSSPIGSSDSRAEVAVAGSTLFSGIGATLRAHAVDTGVVRWSTKLSDKVTSACPECFQVVGSTLVVKTDDGYLYGFGPTSSEPLWSRRLNSTQGGVSVVAGKLYLVDEPTDSAETTPVVTLDPRSGKSLHKVRPACPVSDRTPWKLELGAGTPIHAVPGSTDVVAVFGFGDGCAARWDPNGTEMTWTLRMEGASSIDQDGVLVGAKHLVATTSGTIVSVDLATGRGALLGGLTDASASADRIVGDTLIGDTVSTRGTTKGGLAAWNLADGKLLWSTPLPGGAKVFERTRYHSTEALFDDAPRSLVVPDGSKLRVWTFRGEDRSFSVQTLDPRTGDLGTPTRRDFESRYDSGTPSVGIDLIDAQRVLISVDSLTQAIPVSGAGDIATFPKQD